MSGSWLKDGWWSGLGPGVRRMEGWGGRAWGPGRAPHPLAMSPKLLTINTALYPNSANTWDSLALAYQQAGNKQKAIEHYANALKRDPKFPSALKGLKELKNN